MADAASEEICIFNMVTTTTLCSNVTISPFVLLVKPSTGACKHNQTRSSLLACQHGGLFPSESMKLTFFFLFFFLQQRKENIEMPCFVLTDVMWRNMWCCSNSYGSQLHHCLLLTWQVLLRMLVFFGLEVINKLVQSYH